MTQTIIDARATPTQVQSAGGPPGPSGSRYAATLAEMPSMSMAGMLEGQPIWCAQLKSPFRYLPNSTLTADGITVVNALGGGRLVRDEYASPEWAAFTQWHIDFAGGDDTRAGNTIGTALLTWGELVRRIGRRAVFRDHDVDIYTYGEHTAADAINIDWTVITPNDWSVQRKVRVFADACVPYHSGTLTAVQNINRATRTPQKVTDPTNPWAIPPVKANRSPPGTNSTADAYLLKITSGPRAGAAAWVANANNPIVGGQVRTTTWYMQNPNPYLGGTIVSPQVGDQYICTQQRALFVDNIRVTGTVGWGGAGMCGVWFYNYEIFPNYGFDTQDAGRWQSFQLSGGGCIVLVECFIQGASHWSGGATNYSANIYLSNCAGRDSTLFTGYMFVLVDAGSYHLGVSCGGGAYVALDAGVFGLTGAHQAYNGGHLIVADACSFDLPGHSLGAGFLAYEGGVLVTTAGWPSFYGTDAIWGDLTCQYGVRVGALSRWFLDPAWTGIISVQGTDGLACVGDVQTPGSPAKAATWDPAADPPALTTKRDLTLANLRAALNVGGLNYSATDPLADAKIVRNTGSAI